MTPYTPEKDIEADWTPPTSDDESGSSWAGPDVEKKQTPSADSASLTQGLSSDDLSEMDDEMCDNYSHEFLRRRNFHMASNVATMPLSEDVTFDEADFINRFRRDSAVDGKVHGPVTKLSSPTFRVVTMTLVVIILAGLASFHFISSPQVVRPRFFHDEWTTFMKTEARRVRRDVRKSHPSRSFTIKLSGSRLDLLQQSIESHSKCALVDQVQVDWHSELPLPKKILRHASRKVAKVGDLLTDAVLLLDEDVMLSCEELERGAYDWYTYEVAKSTAMVYLYLTLSAVSSPRSLWSLAKELRPNGWLLSLCS